MNQYLRNLDRLEFIMTLACTGSCRHCSEGSHAGYSERLDGKKAAEAVISAASAYGIKSVMTFGGEPLLCPEDAFMIHSAAKRAGIPKRQIITNGFFSRDPEKITHCAERLVESGANAILLSADSFHQETIPLEPVMKFAEACLKAGAEDIRLNPAWLISPDDPNPYNLETRRIVSEFEKLGISSAKGNVIFPQGNARIYLADYFDLSAPAVNPYDEDPSDLHSVSVSPDGSLLGGNIYREDILDILERYAPNGSGAENV